MTGESKSSELWLGIFGSGQLAKMLCQAAREIKNVKTALLAASSADSAVSDATSFVLEGEHSKQSYKEFLCSKKFTAVTYENEFLDYGALKTLPNETAKVAFRPEYSVLERLSNKLTQKKILMELAIPTSRFVELRGSEQDALNWLQSLPSNFPNGFALKWSRFGYDGKGVLLFPKERFSNLSDALSFCKKAFESGSLLYAEELIPFKDELAMVCCAASTSSGHPDGEQVFSYPLVGTTQKNGICFTVFSLNTDSLSTELQKELTELAMTWMEKFSNKLSYAGSFAFEFFLTKTNKLLVNEIAPRVHNSAHYSLSVFPQASQFHNHVRACVNLPIVKPTLSPNVSFGMVNLLGFTSSTEILVNDIESSLQMLKKLITNFFRNTDAPWEFEVFWYAKWPIKPGRKMGHINFWTRSATGQRESAKSLAQKLSQALHDQASPDNWQTCFESKGS